MWNLSLPASPANGVGCPPRANTARPSPAPLRRRPPPRYPVLEPKSKSRATILKSISTADNRRLDFTRTWHIPAPNRAHFPMWSSLCGSLPIPADTILPRPSAPLPRRIYLTSPRIPHNSPNRNPPMYDWLPPTPPDTPPPDTPPRRGSQLHEGAGISRVVELMTAMNAQLHALLSATHAATDSLEAGTRMQQVTRHPLLLLPARTPRRPADPADLSGVSPLLSLRLCPAVLPPLSPAPPLPALSRSRSPPSTPT